MRTFCPHCETTFRITPEQLKARAGKVRCGQCQTVFNALDCLLDEAGQVSGGSVPQLPPIPTMPAARPAPPAPLATPTVQEIEEPSVPVEPMKPAGPAPTASFPPTGLLDFPSPCPPESAQYHTPAPESPPAAPAQPEWPTLPSHEDFPPALDNPTLPPSDVIDIHTPAPYFVEDRVEPRFEDFAKSRDIYTTDEVDEVEALGDDAADVEPFSRTATIPAADDAIGQTEVAPPISKVRLRELRQNAGLVLPRDTTEIPGYSRWAEDVVSSPIVLPEERPTRWPFVLVALLLGLLLTGQVAFHYRSEIAIKAPSLKPVLQLFSETFNTDLALPRHVERVSIEASDLQTDRSRNNLLLLTATVRNRARYEQAYPSLELSLTDTGDTPIVRRVFGPADYLPPAVLTNQPFAASSDVAVRLWIDAKDVTAAGYRLYVFYP